MDLQDLTYFVLALTVMVCGCLLLLGISVMYLHLKLRRIHQKFERLYEMENDFNRNTTESRPHLREILPLRAEPEAGESITVLHRDPHLPLPTQFVNTEVSSGQNNPSEDSKTEGSNLSAGSNEGFETESNE
ncbi:hypothetical protein OS493_006578 [Desmophyllum pertusum]|uniref:Uncharacterized protein n=1 Tax=Desmophyllum pertusum TaxID=174260 RepID=A0A9X0A5R7_9CNID|nr:hypothetical protein OS493_006578 [Desmophyllum pertusum]